MTAPAEQVWRMRLDRLAKTLEANRFEVFRTEGAEETITLVLRTIIPRTEARTVAWGGSKTVRDTGLYRALKEEASIRFLDPFTKGLPLDQSMELRRKALWVDLFITGSNAVTEAGQLVNLDRTGNRVAAISFGPKSVVLLVGRNKVVPDLQTAMRRVKQRAAPLVADWLKVKTPCVRTSACQDCSVPDRLCNTWSIVEKSYPAGRLKVILINQDLGF